MRQLFFFLICQHFAFAIVGQNSSFTPTYTFEGMIKTTDGEELPVKMNFLVLLDSTIVGSYYYKPVNGSLKLVGKLKSDNTFWLNERDNKDSITGYFNGTLAADKKSASGKWLSPTINKSLLFSLKVVEGKSYWNYIKKNRALHEYSDIELAIREKDNVLSIDVASQGLNKLPNELAGLKQIVSINLLGNNFTTFPAVLSQLTTLNEISLSSNNLTYVGKEIGQLKNLRILIMNFNQLTELPKEIGELANLLYLEIGNNKLMRLPEEIKYLTNLQEMHIERNGLSESEKLRLKKLLPNCVIYF